MFFILFSAALLLVPAYFLPMYILGKALIFTIIYYWYDQLPSLPLYAFLTIRSRKLTDIPMSFFMINFPSMYFPWVLIGFRLLVGETPIDEIIGVIIGHIYLFLADLYPMQSGHQIISTPQFLKDLFPQQGARGTIRRWFWFRFWFWFWFRFRFQFQFWFWF
jgi:hypothetical protein